MVLLVLVVLLFCSLDSTPPPPLFDIPPGSRKPRPPDLDPVISLSTLTFYKGVSLLVFNSPCLPIQCTYPVQFIVPTTPSKQNNNKADKNAKSEEQQV